MKTNLVRSFTFAASFFVLSLAVTGIYLSNKNIALAGPDCDALSGVCRTTVGFSCPNSLGQQDCMGGYVCCSSASITCSALGGSCIDSCDTTDIIGGSSDCSIPKLCCKPKNCADVGGQCASSCATPIPGTTGCGSDLCCPPVTAPSCTSQGGECTPTAECYHPVQIPTSGCPPLTAGYRCCYPNTARICESSSVGGECRAGCPINVNQILDGTGCPADKPVCCEATSNLSSCSSQGGICTLGNCTNPVGASDCTGAYYCCPTATLPTCTSNAGYVCTALKCFSTPIASSDCGAPNSCCNNTSPNNPGAKTEYQGPPPMTMQEIISFIYGILLPVSIGFGVYNIIKAGYTIKTSEGNPQKKQQGFEDLSAAIIGTIFVGLSLTLLKIIINAVLGGNQPF